MSARRKKGKVKYTKILKKGANLGNSDTNLITYPMAGAKKRTFLKHVCIFILTYVIATIFLFLKHTLKGEPKANLSIASI